MQENFCSFFNYCFITLALLKLRRRKVITFSTVKKHKQKYNFSLDNWKNIH